jgi:hypothetical protein
VINKLRGLRFLYFSGNSLVDDSNVPFGLISKAEQRQISIDWTGEANDLLP